MKLSKISSHLACVNATYQNGPARYPVPQEKIPWSIDFTDYKPVQYTAPVVLKGPVWADKNITDSNHSMKFNSMDGSVNRVSHWGDYDVVNGLPINPLGRTGIAGRGLLGKWGPNHAADPIVTRWKRDEKGVKVVDANSKKPVLEFVGIKRRDTGDIAVPGGMVDAGDTVSATLKKEFGEEALNSMAMSAEERQKVTTALDSLFKYGVTIYKGYVDDPRNTDNAWMETVAVNFHDDGTAFSSFKLSAGDDAGEVYWIPINNGIKLYANHSEFIKATAEANKAHW